MLYFFDKELQAAEGKGASCPFLVFVATVIDLLVFGEWFAKMLCRLDYHGLEWVVPEIL